MAGKTVISKTVVKGMKGEVIKKALSKGMKTNITTIELPGKGEIVINTKDDGEILSATLNRKLLPTDKLQEIINSNKFTSNRFVAVGVLPICFWSTNPITRQKTWVCPPLKTCPPGQPLYG